MCYNKTQSKIDIQVGWSQSAISKKNKTNLFKMSSCSFNSKTTARDECQLNKIFISNRFAICSEISKSWNDAGVAVSQSTTLQRLHQLKYHSRILILKPLVIFKQKQNHWICSRDQNWSVDQWNQVIFSDESRFSISFGLCIWRKIY